MPMTIRLVPLTIADLRNIADETIPAGLMPPPAADALPPAFVARRSLDQIAAGKPLAWCGTYFIVRVHDGVIVGGCGFNDAPADGSVEIGYGVAAAFRNTGIATAAIASLLDIARARGEVHSVLAQIDPDNLPSRRVVEKLGFRYVGATCDADGIACEQWVAEASRPQS